MTDATDNRAAKVFKTGWKRLHAMPKSAAEPELRAGAVGDREVAQARPTDRVERVARVLAKRNRAEDWDYFIPQAEAVLEAADEDATEKR